MGIGVLREVLRSWVPLDHREDAIVALDDLVGSWETKGDLLAKSAVRIAELDAIVRQQSQFGQEQHAYIVQLEKAISGLLWLDNNRHEYGTGTWLNFFDAVVEDSRTALQGEPCAYGCGDSECVQGRKCQRRIPTGDGGQHT